MQKDNGMAAMLDDKTKRSVIQHGCHTIVFWISRDWLQTKNKGRIKSVENFELLTELPFSFFQFVYYIF